MMMNRKIEDLLDDKVFPIIMREKVRMRTNNGLVNEDELLGLKKLNVCKAFTYVTKEFVTSTQEYPEGGYSTVNLNMDCVVMSLEDFKELKRLLNE